MKKYLIATASAALLALLSGCGTTATFVYPAKMDDMIRIADSPLADKTVTVAAFEDYRGAANSQSAWLIMIPLVPYDWVEYHRPEATVMFPTIYSFDFKPTRDLAKAAALSLRRSGMFSEVFLEGERSDTDLVLHGAIKSTKYTGVSTTYGLSFIGACFWIFGLPSGNSENELTIYFNLTRGKKIVWEYTYSGKKKFWQGYYSRWGHDVSAYPELMQNAMNEAIADMNKTLKNRPGLLK